MDLEAKDYTDCTYNSYIVQSKSSENIGIISCGNIPNIKNGGIIENITGEVQITTLENFYFYIPYRAPILESGTINTISGGTISTLNNNFGSIHNITAGSITTFNNKIDGTVGTISNSAQITTLDNQNLIENIAGGSIQDLTSDGTINTISGGTIQKLINNDKYSNSTINAISGGTIVELSNGQKMTGTVLNKYTATINAISGGSISTLNNEAFGTITEISGGANITTLNNENTINTISGGSIETLNNKSTYIRTKIDTISGGNIGTLNNENAIDTITGGSVGTLTNKGILNSIANASITKLAHQSTNPINSITAATITTLENPNTITSITDSAVGTLTNSGTLTSIKGGSVEKLTHSSYTAIDTIDGVRVGTLENSGGIGTLTNGSVGTLTNKSAINNGISGTSITTLDNQNNINGGITNASIETLKNTSNINGGITNSSVGTLTNSGTLTSIKGGSVEKLTHSGSTAIDTIDGVRVGTLENNGGIGALTKGSVGTLTNKSAINNGISGTSITTLDNQNNINGGITNASIETLKNTSNINGGITNSSVGTLTNTSNIDTIAGSVKIQALENSGTIKNLTLNENLGLNSSGQHLSGTIDKVTVQSWRLKINSPASEYNAQTSGAEAEHIYSNASVGAWEIAPNAITLDIGEGVDGGEYDIKAFITGADDDSVINAQNLSIETAHQGVSVGVNGSTFSLKAHATQSLGAAALTNMALSLTHRNIRTQGLLDSIMGQSFSDFGGFFEQGAFDNQGSAQGVLSALSGVKFAALNNFAGDFSNLNGVAGDFSNGGVAGDFSNGGVSGGFENDGVNLGGISSANSKKASNLSGERFASANNVENSVNLLNESGEMSNEKWRFFALPYALFGSYKPNGNESSEFGGGVLLGVQRNLADAGVLGAYLGYEFSKSETTLSTASTRLDTNAFNLGLTHHINLGSEGLWYVKSNLRANFELPKFSADSYGYTANLSATSVGAQARAGRAFRLGDSALIAPELGFSYDMLMMQGFTLDGSVSERYAKHTWHLPQILGGVKWLQSYGRVFKTAISAGLHYNLLNKPSVEFSIARLNDSANTELPSIYANVGLNAIWQITQKSELSVGYSGIFHNDGIANAVAIKYGLRF